MKVIGNKRRPARFSAAVAAGVLACVVAGCGGSGASGGVVSASAPKDLTIGMPSQLLSMNPNTSLDTFGQAVIHLTAGTLFELVDGHPVPALARSATSSSNGLVWTVRLRPHVTFSNGTALTSADVKASLDYAMHDKNQVNPSFFAHFAAIAAPTPESVTMKLKAPYPALKTLLGYYDFAIYPAKNIKQSSFFTDPVSAGPYMLASKPTANSAQLVRNPRYVGSSPVIPKISISVVPDANSAVAQVQSGRLDLAYGLPANTIGVIPKDERRVVPGYGDDISMLNISKRPLSEVGVRRAISEAINRDQLSQLAWHSTIPGLEQVLPATLQGHDPRLAPKVNVAGAKQDLQGTSCAHGCSLTLTYSPDEGAEATQEAVTIQNNLKAIGINLSLNQVDGTGFNNAYLKNSFQMMLSPIYTAGPIPDDILSFALPLGSNVYAKYPGMVAAMNKSTASSGAAKSAALRYISSTIMKNLPWLPLTGVGLVAASRTQDAEVLSSRAIGIKRKNGNVY